MQKLTLKSEKRKAKQKAKGKIPAVLYGPKTENTSLFVDFGEFKKVWREAGESTVISLGNSVSKSVKPVLIYDVQLDPLSSEPRHVDFYAVDMTKKTTADISLEFVGEAGAVRLGGTLVKVLHEIEVEALPADLPHELKVDISKLITFDDKILVKDVLVPSGVEVMAGPDEVVAFVEEVKEEAVPAEERTIADVEVSTEKKKEEEKIEETKEENPKS